MKTLARCVLTAFVANIAVGETGIVALGGINGRRPPDAD
jgi:hypothetical protein